MFILNLLPSVRTFYRPRKLNCRPRNRGPTLITDSFDGTLSLAEWRISENYRFFLFVVVLTLLKKLETFFSKLK